MGLKRFYILSPRLGLLRVKCEFVLAKHDGVVLESAHIEDALNCVPVQLEQLDADELIEYRDGIANKLEEIAMLEELYRIKAGA